MSWTEDRVALLTKLWKEGKTAKEIADTLGGVTRNAVIGKAHRLNLSGRSSPISPGKKRTAVGAQSKKTKTQAQEQARPPSRKPEKQSTPANSKTKPATPPPANLNLKASSPSSPRKKGEGYQLADLKDSMCRWPSGDPKEDDFYFCGERSVPGLPYCEAHSQKAYQLNKKAKILSPEALEGNTRRDDEDQEQLA